jgi:DNA-binding MarR family transcriptional regulator
MTSVGEINSNDYRALAEFRYQIRRFLRFSEQAARDAGLEPQQHQLLLAIKGLPDDSRATIGEIAERLQVQHHSTVELVDRMVKRGYVQRKRGPEDRREVLLQLTAKGEKTLRELSLHHQEELRTAGPELIAALKKAGTKPARKTKTAAKTAGKTKTRRATAGSRKG